MQIMSGNKSCKVKYVIPGARLPSAFQEVEYIESSGTQYIDSGTEVSNSIIVELEIYFDTALNNNRRFISYENSSSYTNFDIYYENGKIIYRAGVNMNYHSISYSVSSPTKCIVKHSLLGGEHYAYINGELINHSSYNEGAYSGTTLFLFARNNGISASYFGIFKLFGCKIWSGNTLVRNFIPCYRKADNVAGLYDLVNGVFYTNAGTGTFTVGGNVGVPVEIGLSPKLLVNPSGIPSVYQEVEYLESTGTQYIDTNLVAKNTMSFELKMQQSANGSSKIFGSRYSASVQSFALYFNSLNGLTFNFYGNILITQGNFDNIALTLKGDCVSPSFECSVNGIVDKTLTIESGDLYNGNMLLMSYNNSGNPVLPNTTGQFRLYSCRIYDNSVLVRNFIPCYRKADNVAGLYDLVNGVFYTNAGTGTFTKGADVYKII